MKPQDLKIGNFLTVGNYDVKVVEIHHLGVRVWDLEETQDTLELFSDRIKPIPLTEEWLLKFGFKQQGQRKMWVKDRVCVVLETYTDLSGKPTPEAFYIGFKDLGNVLFHTTLKVKYVHELQNAFALTGGELTIKSE
jgi:hypothetical protein